MMWSSGRSAIKIQIKEIIFCFVKRARLKKCRRIPDAVDAPSQELGVTVEICEIKKNFDILSNETGYQELCEIFAIYLTDYKDIKISLQERTLDPEKAISEKVSNT